MKLKGIELNGTYKIVYYDAGFIEVYNKKGKRIYFEDNNGYWERREYNEEGNVIYSETNSGLWAKSKYNEKGNMIYRENSNGFWEKSEYDEKGNRSYYENSDGEIIDKRVKELTIEEIENLLGYKIKIKGERK